MPLRDDLLNPIPGGNPSGADLRYDPLTDKIKEARREDDDVPQGEWQRVRKLADYPAAIKLCGEALAVKGKDLQIAVWMIDALVRREGFVALGQGFRFLHSLLDTFWDTLYPELEDGDAELRAAPLDWLGSKLEEPIRGLPIAKDGKSWFKYKESRTIGYEADANSDAKRKSRKAAIEEGKLTAEEFDASVDSTDKAWCEKTQADIDEAQAAIEALAGFCDTKFGNSSPSFLKLKRALEEISTTLRIFINKKGGPTPVAAPQIVAPEPAPVAASAAAAVAAVSAAAAPAPSPPPSGEPSSVEDAAGRIAAICRWLRKQDVYNVAPLLMLRGLRWGELRYDGANTIDAKLLDPPPAEIKIELKKLAAAKDWDQVIEVAENAMAQPYGRAWLDLQRYVVRAYEGKGAYFVNLATAVKCELRGLLQDLPYLLKLTLADDSPVANAETLEWINNEVMNGVAAPAVPPPPPAVAKPPEPEPLNVKEDLPSMEDESAVPDAFELALEAARGGRQSEAIDILSRELAQERSGRGRFRRRMQVAHLCMAGGKEKIAYPILEELAAEIQARKLDEWEAGDVLAHPLVLLLRCLDSMGSDEAKRKQVYAAICRLDPLQALRVS